MPKQSTVLQTVFLSFIFSLLATSTVWATNSEQLAIDPVSIALANTVTARPPGLASLHYNPAGLSKMPDGKLISAGFNHARIFKTLKTEADPNFRGFMDTFGPQEGQRHDPLAGQEESNSSELIFLPVIGKLHFIALPTSGNIYRKPGSRWTFARGVIAPFSSGLSNKNSNPNNPNYYWAKNVWVYRINYLTTGAAYQVSDTFSVGLTVAAGMTLFGLERSNRSPSDMTALTKVLGEATEELEIPVLSEETLPPPWFGGGISPYEEVAYLNIEMQDYFSPSYNVGWLWEPKNWFSLGMVYQSPIKNELSGRYYFAYAGSFQKMVDWYGSSPLLRTQSAVLGLPTRSVPYQAGRLTMKGFDWPQRVQVGIMVRPIKRLKLLCDMHWANWTSWSENHLIFDQKIQAFQIAKMSGHTEGDYATSAPTGNKDDFHWSYGAEIDVTKNFCLRFGYEKREASTSIQYASPMSMPDLDKYGVGFGIKFDNGAMLDLGYGYAEGEEYIPDGASVNANSLDFTKSLTSPYPGLNLTNKMVVHLFNIGITKPVDPPEETAVRKKEKFKKLKQNLKHFFKKLNPFKK